MTPKRLLATFALSLALISGSTASAFAAPEPPPAEGEEAGEGRVWDGYFLAAALSGLGMFLVCKSARRS